MFIALIIGYIFFTLVTFVLSVRHIKNNRMYFDTEDFVMSVICSLIWPLSWVCIILLFLIEIATEWIDSL